MMVKYKHIKLKHEMLTCTIEFKKSLLYIRLEKKCLSLTR